MICLVVHRIMLLLYRFRFHLIKLQFSQILVRPLHLIYQSRVSSNHKSRVILVHLIQLHMEISEYGHILNCSVLELLKMVCISLSD